MRYQAVHFDLTRQLVVSTARVGDVSVQKALPGTIVRVCDPALNIQPGDIFKDRKPMPGTITGSILSGFPIGAHIRIGPITVEILDDRPIDLATAPVDPGEYAAEVHFFPYLDAQVTVTVQPKPDKVPESESGNS